MCSAFFAVCFLCSGQGANADYCLKEPAEKYVVVPDSWELKHEQSGNQKELQRRSDDHSWSVECTYKGVKHRWPIDLFWLADRLDDNIACAGDWRKMTDSYLKAECELSKTNKVSIEAVALKQGGPLMATGIWTFGPPPKYEEHLRNWGIPKRAQQAKDPAVTAEQFKKIGNR